MFLATEIFWLACRIPSPLIYISLNKNITIVICLVLQSTLTHVNKWAWYSAIAPDFYKQYIHITYHVVSKRDCCDTDHILICADNLC